MLVIQNPFGLMVYLVELMNETPPREFRRIYIKATTLAFIVLFVFMLIGETLLRDVFQVELPAMKLFGGVITFAIAYGYIVHGPSSIRLFRGDITQLAQQVALPFMVGAGVIWMSMKLGQEYPVGSAAAVIAGELAVTGAMVLSYHWFYKRAKGPLETAMVKYFAMAMRVNALLIGAVSIQMMLSGLHDYIVSRSWSI